MLAVGEPAPQQCLGNAVSVTYTLEGAAGTLTLQLSGADGVFDEDTADIGSLQATESGEIVGFIPPSAALGGMYRLRLSLNAGELVSEPTTVPFSLNPDEPPAADPESSSFFGLVGDAFSFTANAPEAASFLWEFGDGSATTSENPVALYESPGIYNVDLTATSATGCSTTEGFQVVAVTCDASIPDDASVVTDTGSMIGGGGRFETWVCDGGEVSGGSGGGYNFYLESGSEITVGSGGLFVIHAKTGSTVTYGSGGAFAILRETGVTLNNEGGGLAQIFDCPAVEFDLTSAPTPGCP
ncbi:MAG: PKD domain-containing protein, partial [Polyangiales bacterium]